MENTLDKFRPIEAKLDTLTDKYKGLTIKGIDDKKGYDDVHNARMVLVTQRTDIAKLGKALRDPANQFAKSVIEEEKRLISKIEPTEKELEEKEKEIDRLKEDIKRKKQEELDAKFNDRVSQLQAFNKMPTNIMWLKDCTDTEFNELLVLAIKEFEEQEEINKQIQLSKDIINNCKTLEELELIEISEHNSELFNQRKERLTFEKSQKELDEKQKVIDEQNRKIKEELEEKQKVIDEQNRKIKEEQDKIAKQKELDEVREQEGERIKKQQEIDKQQETDRLKKEKETIEKRKKYQQYLDSIGYTEGPDFKTEKTDTHMIIYKKIGEFKYI